MEDNHSLSLFIIFGFLNKMPLKLAIEEKVWIKVTLACGASCRHSSSVRPHAGKHAGTRAAQKRGSSRAGQPAGTRAQPAHTRGETPALELHKKRAKNY